MAYRLEYHLSLATDFGNCHSSQPKKTYNQSIVKLKALIVDDQAMAREHLRRLLKDEPDIEVVGQCASGKEAVEAVRKQAPDVIFLDVQMPGMSGFDVLAQLKGGKKLPAVIFVTALNDFAVKAFEVHALDYLIKPADPARLKDAIERAKTQLSERQTGQITEQLANLLEDLKKGSHGAERLTVKSEGRVLIIKTDDVSWIEAADNYVKLHVGAESHLVRETMNAIEARLSPEKFLRISRSTIVNVERIKELQPLFHGEYVVILRDGTRLTLTRNYRDKLPKLGMS